MSLIIHKRNGIFTGLRLDYFDEYYDMHNKIFRTIVTRVLKVNVK